MASILSLAARKLVVVVVFGVVVAAESTSLQRLSLPLLCDLTRLTRLRPFFVLFWCRFKFKFRFMTNNNNGDEAEKREKQFV